MKSLLYAALTLTVLDVSGAKTTAWQHLAVSTAWFDRSPPKGRTLRPVLLSSDPGLR